jgi:hypothetical protein
MALSFARRQADRDAKKAAEAAAGGASTDEGNAASSGAVAGDDADKAGSGATAGAGAGDSAKASAATSKLRVGPRNVTKASSKPLTIADGSVSATVDGFEFPVPAGSALGKALSKAAKGLQAAAAAFEGE